MRLRRTKRPRVGALTVERGPAPVAPDLQRDGRPGGRIRPRTTARRPARTFRRRSLTPTFEAVAVGVVPWGSGSAAAGMAAAQNMRNRARRRTARHANRDWASRRGPPSVVGRPTRRLWVTTAGHRAAASHLVPHPAGHRALPARRSNGRSMVAKRALRGFERQCGQSWRSLVSASRMRLLAVPSGTCSRRGDLVGGQAAPVGEHERLALGLGQAPQRRAHRLARRHRARARAAGESSAALASPLDHDLQRSDARPAAWPSRHRSSARERAISAGRGRARRGRRRTRCGRRQTRRKTSCTTSWAWAALPRTRSAAA